MLTNLVGRNKEGTKVKEYTNPIMQIVLTLKEDIITTSLNQFDNIEPDINWGE